MINDYIIFVSIITAITTGLYLVDYLETPKGYWHWLDVSNPFVELLLIITIVLWAIGFVVGIVIYFSSC